MTMDKRDDDNDNKRDISGEETIRLFAEEVVPTIKR